MTPVSAPFRPQALRAHCEFCNTPVRDFMRFCPTCRILLSEEHHSLGRTNILMREAGSWIQSGDVPRESAEKLLGRYRIEREKLLSRLTAHSPRFIVEAIPMAGVAVAPPPVVPPVPPIPVVGERILPPAPPVAAPPVPTVPSPDAVAPVEVLELKPGGDVVEKAPPKVRWQRPARPVVEEERVLGVLSETHLAWIANAGIFAVFVAIVLLVKNQWDDYRGLQKTGLLGLGALGALGLGGLLYGKTFLKTTGKSLFILGALSVPVVFASAAWFDAFPGVDDSLIGLAAAAAGAFLYYALALRSDMKWFAWLGVASILAGQGFLLDLCGASPAAFAPGYAILGAALAAAAVARPARTELYAAAAATLIGATIASAPLVNELPPALGLAGFLASALGFAVLSRRETAWIHGTWIALGAASLFACHAWAAPWPWWPATLAATAAAILAAALRPGPRAPALLTGGGTLLSLAVGLSLAGFAAGKPPLQPEWGLLFTASIASLACAAVGWKKDDALWAGMALALPGLVFISVKRLLGLETGWLPVGLGAYAAVLCAASGRANVFSRAGKPVGILAHVSSFLVCVSPAVLFGKHGTVIPFYWSEFPWRAAIGLALPGLAQAVFCVKRDSRWVYGAEGSLIAALVFAAAAVGVPAAWAPALIAVAALAALGVARGSNAEPARQLGTLAVIPAAIAGVLYWQTACGSASLAASGLLLAVLGASVRDSRLYGAGVALAGAAWFSSCRWLLRPEWSAAISPLCFVPAAVVSILVRDAAFRLATRLGAALPAAAALAVSLTYPAAWSAPGAGYMAIPVAALAATTLWLGFRQEYEEAWSAAGAAHGAHAGAIDEHHHGDANYRLDATCSDDAALTMGAGVLRAGRAQSAPYLGVGAVALSIALAASAPEGASSFAWTAALAAAPAMLLAFTGPGRELAAAAAAALATASTWAFAGDAHVASPWLGAAIAAAPLAFTLAGRAVLGRPQALPWMGIGASGLVVALAAGIAQSELSFAIAATMACVPAFWMCWKGPFEEIASGAAASLASLAAAAYLLAVNAPMPYLPVLTGALPAAFAFAGRSLWTRKQGIPFAVAGAVGLGVACAYGASASALAFALAATLATVPAFVYACQGPHREATAGASAALASLAGLGYAIALHIPAPWIPVAAGAVPLAFVALGSLGWNLPQGRPWAVAGGVGLAVAIGCGLPSGALPLGVLCLMGAAGSSVALRFSPVLLPGVASMFFNAALACFLVHAQVPASLAAPILMTIAAFEAVAGSLAGRDGAGHALFAAAAALALAALGWSAWVPSSATPSLLPAMACTAVFGATAAILARIRRQPYLLAVATSAAVALYFLTLRHFGVERLEAFTFPPAAALLAWATFIARREITVSTDALGGTRLEAALSAWARSLHAGALQQLAGIRSMTLVGALLPSVWLALPPDEHVHTFFAIGGGAAALVLGVLARKRNDAVIGGVTIGGMITLKAIEWMIERDLSAAWWILVIGGSLLALVAVFEVRRNWYLKSKGEGVRKLVEAYLGKWE
ncbi:MAG: hypothetical protein HYY18_21710 [Planctomycetes bacterium]|nr:hypothetical protein [Planctomycetota bacterium]